MKFLFLTVGHKLPPWLDEVARDYEKKLSYWFSAEVRVLKPSGFGREASEKKKSREGQSLIQLLKFDDFVVACDEKGKDYDSKDFSRSLENILNSGKKRVVIIIGGAYGLEDDVLAKADLKLCLSTFTLNHHLALAVILEQVYRAMTLLKGIKYHND